MAGAGAVEAGMYFPDFTVLVDKNGSRVGHHLVQHRQRLRSGSVGAGAGKYHRVVNSEAVHHFVDFRIGDLRFVVPLERESNDLDATVFVLFVPRSEVIGLIHTVRAPRAHNLDNDGLACKTRIFQ
ncbi:hypothetical protein D3C86_1610780 [compost metagenome]